VTAPTGSLPGRRLALALALVVLGAAGCSLSINTLGGREKCWPETPPRAASVWRGILQIDANGGRLATPEGDVIPLLPGTLGTRVGNAGGELVRGGDVVAKAGDDVTLFGGAGGDGALVVCDVEEIHSRS
jgi:hypothetical protein